MPNYAPPKIVYVKRPSNARPIYERSSDTDNEKKFANLVEQNSDFKVSKLKSFFPGDLAFVREKKIIAICEFKRRFGAFGYPGGIFLSADKLSKLQGISKVTGTIPLFAIETAEGQYYIAHLDKPSYPTIIGGRIDRNDAQDIEPVCLIEKRDFQPFVKLLRSIEG